MFSWKILRESLFRPCVRQLPTLSLGLDDTVEISMCKSSHNPLKVTEQYQSDRMVMGAGCYSQSSLTV